MQSEIDGPSETDTLKQYISELEAENNKIKVENIELKPELWNWKISNRKTN